MEPLGVSGTDVMSAGKHNVPEPVALLLNAGKARSNKRSLTRLLVYSHDAFGMGNMRRMLSISCHLLKTMPDVSVLLVTGSPLIQNFRLTARLDYVKLPCIRRAGRENYGTKYLGTEFDHTMRLRSGIISRTVEDYDPHLVLVDKKPFGIHGELKPALQQSKMRRPHVPHVLVLRDILDSPEATIPAWTSGGYSEAICQFYDLVAVFGRPEVFNLPAEYHLPDCVAEKVRFCGYIRREPGRRGADQVRKELGAGAGDHVALVTAGGGEDSRCLMETYLASLPILAKLLPRLRTLLVTGPEAPLAEREHVNQFAKRYSNLTVREFSDDLMSYMAATDVVISMGGYNTVCEILSLGKRAVVVPRVRPVEEQWIRARRMEELGLFRTIHPDLLTPAGLAHAVFSELTAASPRSATSPRIDLNGLPRMAELIRGLIGSARLADVQPMSPAAEATPIRHTGLAMAG